MCGSRTKVCTPIKYTFTFLRLLWPCFFHWLKTILCFCLSLSFDLNVQTMFSFSTNVSTVLIKFSLSIFFRWFFYEKNGGRAGAGGRIGWGGPLGWNFNSLNRNEISSCMISKNNVKIEWRLHIKFHHAKPSWNFITDWTDRVEILILCEQIECSHVVGKLQQPGLNMTDITLGFLDNFSQLFLFGCCICPYKI